MAEAMAGATYVAGDRCALCALDGALWVSERAESPCES